MRIAYKFQLIVVTEMMDAIKNETVINIKRENLV